MKARDILFAIAHYNICKGKAYIDASRNNKLTILKGELKPRALYYYTFRIPPYMECEPDVILTLGTEEKQYLWKIEK